MQRRRLGRSNLEVSPLGLGGLAISGPFTFLGDYIHFGEVNDNESIRAIHRALNLGVNFFDTAANYGAGHSERILGRAIADRRDEVVIATKFGYRVDEESKSISYYDEDPNSDGIADFILQDCETSLHRLGTDYIDLYQFHINDYPPIKAVKVRDILEELVSEGKIRFYGWSTNHLEGARVFARGKHCVGIQHMLNVIVDHPEMLVLCEEHNLASINRTPLAQGLLSGKYTMKSNFQKNDWRTSDYFQNEWMPLILGKLDTIRDILTRDGRTISQGALAWIWARSKCTIPIPGFRTVAQVEENVEALKFGPLSDNQMQEIDKLLKNHSDE